jgi:hypothetical protein
MQQIPLTQGQFALVDDADYPLLADFKWCYRGERDSLGYAVRHIKIDGKNRLCYLHRSLMEPKPGQEVIFLNHDCLDCRRANLKVVSKEEARRHHRVRSDSETGIKGVRYNPDKGVWNAYVCRNGITQSLGIFHHEEDAAYAYEQRIQSENPALCYAPEKIDRTSLPHVERTNPNAKPSLSESVSQRDGVRNE